MQNIVKTNMYCIVVLYIVLHTAYWFTSHYMPSASVYKISFCLLVSTLTAGAFLHLKPTKNTYIIPQAIRLVITSKSSTVL